MNKYNKIKRGFRKPRIKRPVEKDVPKGYDSNWECELHQGILEDWKFHTAKVPYVVEHNYEPDFIREIEGKKILLEVVDQGEGFKENDTSKIFKRFYSNRPNKFGEHSGLGLNIVKNLVELHNGKISAFNNVGQKGAIIEIIFPKV